MKRLSPQHTVVVMSVLVGLALVWEILTLALGQNATISEFVWTLSENTLFVFAAGFLMGHWFFPKSRCVHCGKYPYRKDRGEG